MFVRCRLMYLFWKWREDNHLKLLSMNLDTPWKVFFSSEFPIEIFFDSATRRCQDNSGRNFSDENKLYMYVHTYVAERQIHTYVLYVCAYMYKKNWNVIQGDQIGRIFDS
jgi:hypothetical protein